jgi:hypothetical protein
MAEMRDKFSELQSSSEPLRDAIINGCVQAMNEQYELERSALMLEVLAEAARNPRVAAIVQAADIEERALAHDLLRRALPADCSERELAARGEVLSMLFDGMAMRGVNNPAGDREAIRQVLRVVLQHLLVDPPCDPAAP